VFVCNQCIIISSHRWARDCSTGKIAALGRKEARSAERLLWSPSFSYKHLLASGLVRAAAQLSRIVGLRWDGVAEQWKEPLQPQRRKLISTQAGKLTDLHLLKNILS